MVLHLHLLLALLSAASLPPAARGDGCPAAHFESPLYKPYYEVVEAKEWAEAADSCPEGTEIATFENQLEYDFLYDRADASEYHICQVSFGKERRRKKKGKGD